jgi:hypothetical protein
MLLDLCAGGDGSRSGRSNIKEALTFGWNKLTIVMKRGATIVIPDCHEGGKSGIHIPPVAQLVVMDSRLALRAVDQQSTGCYSLNNP